MNSYSVLIVDDNADDRYLLKRQINDVDLASHIFEAENGKVAIDILVDYSNNKEKFQNNFPPMLIFLDINMPLLNGFEFLEEFSKLRESNDKYDTIVIMMFTSSEHKRDKKNALSYDFVKGYLTKGDISSDSLRSAVSQSFVE